jgi:hypothetical protein
LEKISNLYPFILDKFSIDNLLNNSFLLPKSFYEFYLTNIVEISKKDETANKIYNFLKQFLELSIQYINDQKERVINRLEHDENLKRYEMDDIQTLYPKGIEAIKQQLYLQNVYDPMYNFDSNFEKNVTEEITRRKEEYIKTSKSDIFRLQKQKSIEKSIFCSDKIIEINNIIFSLNAKNKGGLIEDILLSIDILNLFIFNLDTPQIYFTNTIYDCNQIYKTHDLFINDLENPNLVGYQISIKTHLQTGHATCIYKCNDTYLLYDDNFNGPIPMNWFEYLHKKEFTPQTKLYYYSNCAQKIPYIFDHERIGGIFTDGTICQNPQIVSSQIHRGLFPQKKQQNHQSCWVASDKQILSFLRL